MFGGSEWQSMSCFTGICIISMILSCTYVLCIIPCYLTGILYAVVRQISMLFIDNKISVFCKMQPNNCQCREQQGSEMR